LNDNDKNTNSERSEMENDDLENFIYTISHDLRSPLTAIQGMTQILMEDYEDLLDKDGRYYLERIDANVKKMESLINDLLKLSRAGRIKSPKEQIESLTMVSKIIDDISKEEGISNWNIAIDKSLPPVVYDRPALNEVFYNIIKNAVIFMGDQREPSIEVGYERQDNCVIFHVRDNGIGIESENIDKIFKVFERVRDIDSKGNGVGLAFVKKIIEHYGGKIWVESSKGHGSTFYFTIPYMEADLSEI